MSKQHKEEREIDVDHETLQKILNIGEYYKFTDREKFLLLDHCMGNQMHLLKEGYCLYRSGFTVTKLLASDDGLQTVDVELDIEKFLKDALGCIGFRARVYLGIDFMATNYLSHP